MQEHESEGIGFVAGAWPLDPARPTLVFIHGAGGTSILWNEQVDALSEHVNTLALDLPGHGRSQGEGRDQVEDYAKAVLEFTQRLQVPGMIPCGLSLGGAIAQQLLLDQGNKCKAGILICTGARLKVMPLILDTIEKDYEEYLRSFKMFATSDKTDPARIQPLVDATAKCPPKVALDDFRACDRFDVIDRLSWIHVPVLVITGEDDKLTPPKYGAYLAENIPGAGREHIPEAGHLVPVEKPEEVNSAILSFLEREGLR